MGVKLDWDIEAEKGKNKEHREDRKQRGQRYKGVFRLFLTITVFAAVLGAGVYLVLQRWEQVNQRFERLLSDTVQAEVAAIRVGDANAFTIRQRSATADWANSQLQVFNDYQALKTSSNIVLSGRIENVEIDGQRGRVQVEEIIDGVPYIQTWFYWYYNEDPNCLASGRTETECLAGWYHVPPDYTFWGESQDITTDDYIIRYQDVDSETAELFDQSLSRWLDDSCDYLDCTSFPLITVDIVPAPNSPVRWVDSEQDAWQLIVPSPYTDRARADMPFDTQLQIDTANLLATRMVEQASNNVQPIANSDAMYLRDTIIAWVVGRFTQLNPETYLLQSLVESYSVQVMQNILTNLQPTSDISLIATVTSNNSVGTMPVDWRDFVAWRLALEDSLIEAGNEPVWVTLYDFTNPAVRDAAYQRYLNNFTATTRNVLSADVRTTDDGQPQLIARVNVTRGFESGEEIIVFNLINGNWLRAN